MLKNLFKPGWKQANPVKRKQALIELSVSEHQDIFKEAAVLDEDADIRLLAIRRVNDWHFILDRLGQEQDGRVIPIIGRIISQCLRGELSWSPSLEERVNRISEILPDDVLLELLEPDSEPALKLRALDFVRRDGVLGDVVIRDPEATVREKALSLIEKESTLLRVYKNIKNRDKHIAQIIRQRLPELAQDTQELQQKQQLIKTNLIILQDMQHRTVDQALREEFQRIRSQLDELQNLMNAEQQQQLQSLYENLQNAFDAWSLQQQQNIRKDQQQREKDELRLRIEAILMPVEARIASLFAFDFSQYAELQQQLMAVESVWNSVDDEAERSVIGARVAERIAQAKLFLHQWNQYKELIGEFLQLLADFRVPQTAKQAQALDKKLNKLQQQLQQADALHQPDAIEQQLQTVQRQLREVTRSHEQSLQDELKQANAQLQSFSAQVDAGAFADAQKLLPILGERIAVLEKNHYAPARDLIAQFKHWQGRYAELRSWQSWVSSPKREQLLQELQQLESKQLTVEALSQAMNGIRQQWKELGPITKNELSLRKQFDELFRRMYKPCEAWHKAQNAQKQQNAERRRDYLQQLGEFVENADWDQVAFSKLEMLQKETRDIWSSMGKTGDKDRRGLQKQFNKYLDKISKAVNKRRDKNRAAREALLQQAEALLELSDVSQATREAKELQQQWKQLETAGHGVDGRLYRQFRNINDELFNRSRQQFLARKQQQQDETTQLQEKLNELAAVLNGPWPQFVQQHQQLKQQLQDLKAPLQASNARTLSQHYEQLNSQYRQFKDKLQAYQELQEVRQFLQDLSACDSEALLGQCLAQHGALSAKLDSGLMKSLQVVLGGGVLDDQRRQDIQKAYDDLLMTQEVIFSLPSPAHLSDQRLARQVELLAENINNPDKPAAWAQFIEGEVKLAVLCLLLGQPQDPRHDALLAGLRQQWAQEMYNY